MTSPPTGSGISSAARTDNNNNMSAVTRKLPLRPIRTEPVMAGRIPDDAIVQTGFSSRVGSHPRMEVEDGGGVGRVPDDGDGDVDQRQITPISCLIGR